MSDILGISHIVLSTNNKFDSRTLNTLLEDYFFDGEYFEFDHSTIRSQLIRSEINLRSKLSLLKSRNKYLPALELLYCESEISRPNNFFGLILKNSIVNKPCEVSSILIDKYYINFINEKKFGLNISYDTNIIEEDFGCWIYIKDYDSQKKFLSSQKSIKVVREGVDFIVLKCKIMNSSLTSFNIILIRDTKNKELEYFNDDLGLSTLGWFFKGELKNESSDFKMTDFFEIEILGKKIKARFVYSNKSISHELLKI